MNTKNLELQALFYVYDFFFFLVGLCNASKNLIRTFIEINIRIMFVMFKDV